LKRTGALIARSVMGRNTQVPMFPVSRAQGIERSV